MSTRENREVEGRAEGRGDGRGDGGSPSLGAALSSVVSEVRGLVGGFDASVITAADAAVLVERFAELERLAAGGRLLAAGRMARTSVWAGSGDADVAEWMARTTGQSRSDARKDLAAARVLDELDGTQDALRQGRLTKEQVREIAPAAKAAPGSEGGLLAEAASGSVEGLARKARAAKAAARGDGREAVERVRRRRCVTHGRGEDGSAWVRAAGPPDDIARMLAGLTPWAEQARRAARAGGEVLTDEPGVVRRLGRPGGPTRAARRWSTRRRGTRRRRRRCRRGRPPRLGVDRHGGVAAVGHEADRQRRPGRPAPWVHPPG